MWLIQQLKMRTIIKSLVLALMSRIQAILQLKDFIYYLVKTVFAYLIVIFILTNKSKFALQKKIKKNCILIL